MTDKILTQRRGSVAWIVFNNPARHNAVSLEMWQGAADALRGFMDDESVRLIGITGAGEKAFISGADISKFEDERAQAEAVKKYDAISTGFVEALATIEKPTLARINGYCLGGGLNVALCCDLRIASADSQFGIPAAKLGLGYVYKNFRRLADIVGLAHAREITFTGERIDAARAYEMGLVTRVVPKARLDDEVTKMTETIAANAPLTVRAFKINALEHAKDPADRDLRRSRDAVKACFDSQDYVEGRRAFMEKRPPQFKGH
ncbi:MAG: enoyl-CoA hydratase [Proteobacteria bacterium]|nr:enoyl-CoA hydratase [Pseudomonadota bacterium]MDA1059878.1 enoyl-CoA hydratase [Pseudomonadota bacterium]